MLDKIKKTSKLRNEVRSYISFRPKDDPIRAMIKRQQEKIKREQLKMKGVSQPEFVVSTKKLNGPPEGYDAYNDPYLLRFFSKEGTIK